MVRDGPAGMLRPWGFKFHRMMNSWGRRACGAEALERCHSNGGQRLLGKRKPPVIRLGDTQWGIE